MDLVEVSARRRRRRLRRTKLSDGERGFAGLAAVSLRTARCLPVAGIHAGVRRDGLAMGRAICVGTRGDHRVREISRHGLPLGPARFDGSRSGWDAEIGAARHPAMIDLKVANGGWHTWVQCCWRRLTGALTLLDLRRHGNAPDRVRLKPRAPFLYGFRFTAP